MIYNKCEKYEKNVSNIIYRTFDQPITHTHMSGDEIDSRTQ